MSELTDDIDYVERLIKGVRKVIKSQMDNDPITKEYPDTISGNYIDANLLCMVVEKIILPELTKANEQLKKQKILIISELKCNTCLGEPISGKPCICGGTGTQAGELQGFREALFKANEQLKKQRNIFKEIAKGEGRYAIDHLTRAENAIEDMIELANSALTPEDSNDG